MNPLLVILGPTACGKTKLATQLAYEFGGEIISADSRQVYRNMDIGTGKDLNEYIINDTQIPYHLIDIIESGQKYNLYEFQKDFKKAYEQIITRGKLPILCGGTGLYIESALGRHPYASVPVNEKLRNQLENQDQAALTRHMESLKLPKGFKPDTSTKKRMIRAIEICDYLAHNDFHPVELDNIPYHVLGIKTSTKERRKRISERLQQRLNEGLVEEVQQLLDSGITHSTLEYYGLEYKYVSKYLKGEYQDYNSFVSHLETAIHQFAKRQMTFFRKMERSGIKIHWIEPNLSSARQLIATFFRLNTPD